MSRAMRDASGGGRVSSTSLSATMASATPSTPRAWGPLRTLLVLAPTLLVVPLVLRAYYALPTPLAAPFDAAGRPQLSEATMLGYAKYLSEDIGYRTVGTPEHAAADAWMVQKAEELKAECDARVQKTGRKLECEVWHQRGSGSHRSVLLSFLRSACANMMDAGST
jgi:hypothetical protein